MKILFFTLLVSAVFSSCAHHSETQSNPNVTTLSTKCAEPGSNEPRPYTIDKKSDYPCILIDGHKICDIAFDKPQKTRTLRRRVSVTGVKSNPSYDNFVEKSSLEGCRLEIDVVLERKNYQCYYDRKKKDIEISCPDK